MDARSAMIVANIWFAAGVATSDPIVKIACIAGGFLWFGFALLFHATKEKTDA
jgi:hypothetical protein